MNKARVESFSPISNAQSTRLILGSMPGVASLHAAQYYAHPHNAFWPIMGALLGFSAFAPYAARVEALQQAQIALWDVLACCERLGSLDASIRLGSEVANDFDGFFGTHSAITQVYFNGAAAEAAFKRHCSQWPHDPRLTFQRLPSSSPAHATLRPEQKFTQWKRVLAL